MSTLSRIAILFLAVALPSILAACATPTPTLGQTRVSPLDGMTQVYVPAGAFRMGSVDADNDSEPDQKPQHLVYLDAFWMDQTEVTNAMFARCIEAGACDQVPGWNAADHAPASDYPVDEVTWEMAVSYCRWAGRRTPTEAEWEKAARGTDGRLYPWGEELPNRTLLNFKPGVGDVAAGAMPVGRFPRGASPYGALDMAGNLWEWVSDWYSDTYYATSPPKNPKGPETGAYRACRGGSWNNDAIAVRVTNRGMNDPSHCDGLVGIRCAQDDTR